MIFQYSTDIRNMFTSRLIIGLLFFLVLIFLPQQVLANTTLYRSAGWVGIPLGSTNNYTNLTGCQSSDGVYCQRLLAPGGGILYFSSFGSLSDFAIPQGSTPTAVHFRVTGRGTPVIHWIQVGQGRNRPVTQLCQNPNDFDSYKVYMNTNNTVNNVYAVFTPYSTGGNNFDQCFSANNINAQNFTLALFFNGYYIDQWYSDIDNFEVAFDYTIPPTPTPTITPTATPTPTPTPTMTPTPTPTPIPTPEPFLDLPWNYDCTRDKEPSVNAECEQKGKKRSFDTAALAINSYFDHEYPLQSRGLDLKEPIIATGSVIPFMGPPRRVEPEFWYSSHDGYDYGIKTGVNNGDLVYPAAPGKAEYKYDNGGGNAILIDHGNGYQTRYYHLQDNSTIVKIPNIKVDVDKNTVIGKVGSTGRHTTGPHIHIGVFFDKDYDKNSDHNFIDYEPEGATDPFGWEPYTEESRRDLDPWENYSFFYNGKQRKGSKSYYLWTKKIPNLKEVVTQDGGNYSLSNTLIKIDPDTFIEQVTLEMFSAPFVKVSDSLQSIGPSISITAKNILGDFVTILTKPVKIVWYPFRDSDVSRFKIGTLAIYSSEDRNNWTKEQIVNPYEPGSITAAVSHFTYFALMGERKDIIPPVTQPEFIGEQGEVNWFRSNIVLTLSATDSADEDPAGVDYTLYKKDDEDWQTYTEPLTFSSEEHHVVSFYSGDKDGNIEEVKTVEFDIDKTLPEANIRFDTQTQDITIAGIDNSGETIVSRLDTSANTEQATVSDKAGNILIISDIDRQHGQNAVLSVINMTYNSSILNPDTNKLAIRYHLDKSYSIKMFDQIFEQKGLVKIQLSYDPKTNKTTITQDKQKTEVEGMRMLQLETSQGTINYSY